MTAIIDIYPEDMKLRWKHTVVASDWTAACDEAISWMNNHPDMRFIQVPRRANGRAILLSTYPREG